MTATARRGAALPLALLALVIMGLLATTMLTLASRRAGLVRARLAAVRARHGAEAGVRSALAAWRTADVRGLAVGAQTTGPVASGALPGGTRYEAVVQRLDRLTFLVRGSGRTALAAGDAVGHAALLVRTVDARRVWHAFGGALVVGGAAEARGSARISALRVDTVPPAWTRQSCDSVRGVFGDLYDGARPAVLASDADDLALLPGARLAGLPPVAVDGDLADSAAFAGLGPIGFGRLASIADRRPVGTLELGSRGGDDPCDRSGAGAWGDPLDPASPCATDFPLIVAAGDLEVTGGAGQGVLVVDGDLVLRSGVRFYGPVLVRGSLLIEDDAYVYGAVRAAAFAGRVAVAGDIVYSSCALGRALLLAPALNRPFRPPGRWWVPLL